MKLRLFLLGILVATVMACSLFAPTETPVIKTPFPLTNIPNPTRVGGTPTPNTFVADPYLACHSQRRSPFEFTLFPEAQCADGQCIDSKLKADVYTAWKTAMMQIFSLDEHTFSERIELANVTAYQRGSSVTVTIDYVVVNGWARTFQTHIVDFTEEPDSDVIAEKVQFVIFEDTQINLPQVASVESIESQFIACDPELEINWCYLDYPNFGGRLYVTAFRIIDLDADKCMDAAVYVDTGELWYCRERPCMIDE